jgi:hypothetical protein
LHPLGPGQFKEVVGSADQVPFSLHLGQPPQEELPESQINVGANRSHPGLLEA